MPKSTDQSLPANPVNLKLAIRERNGCSRADDNSAKIDFSPNTNFLLNLGKDFGRGSAIRYPIAIC